MSSLATLLSGCLLGHRRKSTSSQLALINPMDSPPHLETPPLPTQPPPSPNPPSFLSLPPELRNAIYHLLATLETLTDDGPVFTFLAGFDRLLRFARTCTEIQTEYLSIWAQHVRLRIIPTLDKAGKERLERWFRHQGSKMNRYCEEFDFDGVVVRIGGRVGVERVVMEERGRLGRLRRIAGMVVGFLERRREGVYLEVEEVWELCLMVRREVGGVRRLVGVAV